MSWLNWLNPFFIVRKYKESIREQELSAIEASINYISSSIVDVKKGSDLVSHVLEELKEDNPYGLQTFVSLEEVQEQRKRREQISLLVNKINSANNEIVMNIRHYNLRAGSEKVEEFLREHYSFMRMSEEYHSLIVEREQSRQA